MAKKIKKSEVPLTELNEWGYPNELWKFCGYDESHNSSMWRRKAPMTTAEKVASLNALLGE